MDDNVAYIDALEAFCIDYDVCDDGVPEDYSPLIRCEVV